MDGRHAARCPECAGGIDHCHGALVRHDDGLVECTDGACADPDPRRHALWVDCTDALSECQCDLWSSPQVNVFAS